MADVKGSLERISEAIYGREVRGAIHDSIEAINEQVEGYAAGEEARAAAEERRAGAESARASAEDERAAAEEERAEAEGKRAAAEEARERRIDGLVDATGAERVHVCAEGEYEAPGNGGPSVPAVKDPKQEVVYLVPAAAPSEHGDFSAWLYVAGKWEALGGGVPVPLPLAQGGTGGTDAATAREGLSVYSKEEADALFAKKSESPAGGSPPTVTGTTFANKVSATITAIEKGAIVSKVTLKLADGSSACSYASTACLTAMKAAAGTPVNMLFDERDVHVVTSMPAIADTDENVWEGSVEDVETDDLQARFEMSAKGTAIYALAPISVFSRLGLGETSSATLLISPYDIKLMALSRTHTGGGN